MRLVHTADWQLGMAAAQLGTAGAAVRAQRIKSAARVVALANEARADLLLVAGDLFEDQAVERVLIQAAADCLAAFQGPVFILPGNHDPWVPGSVWDHPAWAAAENLTVLVRPKPVPIAQGVLLPCPFQAKHGSLDPTAWITPESGADLVSGFRIGLAHGNVEGLPGADPDFPIAREAARRGALDYLALGHWHSVAFFAQGDDPVRMTYCGTPEPTRFGERESGKALLVEISEPGAAPQITALETGHYIWERLEAEIRQPEDLPALSDTIDALAAPGRTLLELQLRGLLFARQQADLEQLLGRVAARFFFSRTVREQLLPAPEDAGWIEDLPAGILREAARQLMAQAQSSEPIEGNSPGSLALQELYAAVQEARS